jgi:Ribosomal protein HS6-type (S12/L30/L7a)
MSSSHQLEQSKPVPKKRKKNTILIPQRLTENESLELVASPIGPIRTLAVSEVEKSIIIERFVSEIAQKFHFTLSRSAKRPRLTSIKCHQEQSQRQEKELQMTEFAKSRITVGTNSCTRLIEKLYSCKAEESSNNGGKDSNVADTSGSHINCSVSLCILSRDVRPATILSHIPYFCHLMRIPVLLLPGKASLELGSALGTKKVSVIMFKTKSQSCIDDLHEKKWQQQYDSYVNFVKNKIP